MSKNFINDETLTAKTDLSTFTKKDLNYLLGENGERRYTDAELKSIKQSALADDLHTQLVEAQPKKGKKVMSDGTATPKPAFIPRDSKNVACAASKKTNLIKAIIAGKKSIELALQIVAGDPTLKAYWGETVEADLNAAVSGIRPAAVRSAVAQAKRDAAAIEKANRPAKAPRVTVEVELTEAEAAL